MAVIFVSNYPTIGLADYFIILVTLLAQMHLVSVTGVTDIDSSRVLTVGGDIGWTSYNRSSNNIPDYQDWADSLTALINDTLEFDYTPSFYTVAYFTDIEDYNECKSANAVLLDNGTTGSSSWMLPTAGLYLFACLQHCAQGMKFGITAAYEGEPLDASPAPLPALPPSVPQPVSDAPWQHAESPPFHPAWQYVQSSPYEAPAPGLSALPLPMSAPSPVQVATVSQSRSQTSRAPAPAPSTGSTADNIPSAGVAESGLGSLPSPANSKVSDSDSGRRSRLIIVTAVSAPIGFLLTLFLVTTICCCCRRQQHPVHAALMNTGDSPNNHDGYADRQPRQASSDRRYTLAQIHQMTRNFEKQVGEGVFGPVYHGKLPTGREVAVKVLSLGNKKWAGEFQNEVELLSEIHHRNLVPLVGYCEEGTEQFLIFEFIAGGSLRDRLYGPKARQDPLSWSERLSIVCDAARGLEYLHSACHPTIIHRDVKSSCILLETSMVARVSDFGLSMLRQAQTIGTRETITVLAKGTPGYLDPEYFSFHHLSEKSDVYSFGVILLEIVCGSPPTFKDHRMPARSNQLVERVLPFLETGQIESVVDPVIAHDYNTEALWKVIETAIHCVEVRKKDRPTMTEVLRDLNHAYDLEWASRKQRMTPTNIQQPIQVQLEEEQVHVIEIKDPHEIRAEVYHDLDEIASCQSNSSRNLEIFQSRETTPTHNLISHNHGRSESHLNFSWQYPMPVSLP